MLDIAGSNKDTFGLVHEPPSKIEQAKTDFDALIKGFYR